ncbi:MAG: hypothetical protein VKK97_13355 [Synechococcaceae cyanobacterium]|nr:hypothetical protein [Synechococcaceae cyanobacterium]
MPVPESVVPAVNELIDCFQKLLQADPALKSAVSEFWMKATKELRSSTVSEAIQEMFIDGSNKDQIEAACQKAGIDFGPVLDNDLFKKKFGLDNKEFQYIYGYGEFAGDAMRQLDIW